MYTTYQKNTHTHTHTTCLPSDNLLFQPALPTSTSADISRYTVSCLDGMEVCSLYTRRRGQLDCHDLCHGRPTFNGRRPLMLLWACSRATCEKKIIVHAKPNCLITVKFLKYTHNLQMWPWAANTTWWAACWRPMSYANSFTESNVASNIHLLIFAWPMSEYANTRTHARARARAHTHTHTHTKT